MNLPAGCFSPTPARPRQSAAGGSQWKPAISCEVSIADALDMQLAEEERRTQSTLSPVQAASLYASRIKHQREADWAASERRMVGSLAYPHQMGELSQAEAALKQLIETKQLDQTADPKIPDCSPMPACNKDRLSPPNPYRSQSENPSCKYWSKVSLAESSKASPAAQTVSAVPASAGDSQLLCSHITHQS